MPNIHYRRAGCAPRPLVNPAQPTQSPSTALLQSHPCKPYAVAQCPPTPLLPLRASAPSAYLPSNAKGSCTCDMTAVHRQRQQHTQRHQHTAMAVISRCLNSPNMRSGVPVAAKCAKSTKRRVETAADAVCAVAAVCRCAMIGKGGWQCQPGCLAYLCDVCLALNLQHSSSHECTLPVIQDPAGP